MFALTRLGRPRMGYQIRSLSQRRLYTDTSHASDTRPLVPISQLSINPEWSQKLMQVVLDTKRIRGEWSGMKSSASMVVGSGVLLVITKILYDEHKYNEIKKEFKGDIQKIQADVVELKTQVACLSGKIDTVIAALHISSKPLVTDPKA